jgi:hypothetical protein
MKFTLKPKTHKPINFFCNGEYVYADLNGKEGTLGNQICTGGKLTGYTIMCNAEDLPKVARSWWRQYRVQTMLTGRA